MTDKRLTVEKNSHSTMYLLKLYHLSLHLILFLHSHSTMYLLKLNALTSPGLIVTFTFHHVSIKTVTDKIDNCHYVYSHSTMYLLKPFILLSVVLALCHSHSTMYLLKPPSFSGVPVLHIIHIPPCIY